MTLTREQRHHIGARFKAMRGQLATAAVAEIEKQHPWYRLLGAQERSWITIVVTNGISIFIRWFTGEEDTDITPHSIFTESPRSLTRSITLRQTVDLIRTTTDVLESHIEKVVDDDLSDVHLSREVAFASAEIYAGTAESRVSWDEKMEALIINAIISDDDKDDILSRAATLGWNTNQPVCAIVANLETEFDDRNLRNEIEARGMSIMIASHGSHLICLISGPDLNEDFSSLHWLAPIRDFLPQARVIIGSIVEQMESIGLSVHAALNAAKVVHSWNQAPQLVLADDLLPERIIAGDKQAHRQAIETIWTPLNTATDLIETLGSFLDHSCSIEATARALYVHPNTVRYRLKKICDITGYLASDARQAYLLRIALTLGRLHDH